MGRLTRIPDGRKLFGANINIKPSYFLGINWWTVLAQEWDWNGWIRPQIDFVCGNNLGCNAIRLQCSVSGIAQGVYTQEKHDSQLYQIADYCRQLGVHFTFALDAFQPIVAEAFAAKTVSQMADIAARTCDRLATLPNVFGVDVIQEVSFDNIGAVKLREYITEIRRRHTALPLTYSSASATDPITGAPDLESRGLSPLLDYFDFHLYYGPQVRPVTRNTFAFYETNYPNHDIFFGEAGVHQGTAIPLQNTDLAEFFDAGNLPSPKYRGVLIWAPVDNRAVGDGGDPGTVAQDQWGFYTGGNGVAPSQPRPNRIDVMRRYTFGSVARNNAARR